MTLFSYGFRPEAIDPPGIDQHPSHLCPLLGVKRTFASYPLYVRL